MNVIRGVLEIFLWNKRYTNNEEQHKNCNERWRLDTGIVFLVDPVLVSANDHLLPIDGHAKSIPTNQHFLTQCTVPNNCY